MRHVELAPAKINLALHVLGRRSDGYHELDSIVAFAFIADRLTFDAADDWRLDVTGPFSAELQHARDNLVLKAAWAFEQAYPGQGRRYHITLEKNLPVASGIGGGSADAAACLRALANLSGVTDTGKLEDLAVTLGADVPVCLQARTCRMRGLGERIDALGTIAPMPAVLVNPRVAVATADVFAKLALKPGEKAFAGLGADPDLGSCRNDLSAPAMAIAPVIGEVMAALNAEPDLHFARMSGSGATCFGIFSSPAAAEEAARNIARTHSSWWVMPTAIG